MNFNRGGLTIIKPMVRNLLLLWIFMCFSFKSIAQPQIASISPVNGIVGANDTIKGINFSTTPANNIVFIGNIQAQVISANANRLVVTIPAGTFFGPVSATVAGLTAYSSQFFSPAYHCGFPVDSSRFENAVSFGTNASPWQLVTGDLDGDGLPEIIVVNYASGNISIYPNTTKKGVLNSSSLGPKIDLTVLTGSKGSNGITLADLDGDGRLDIVVSSTGDATVDVFQNTSTKGNFSFASKVVIPLPNNGLWDIKVTDMDFDGKPDIIVVRGNGYFSILKNNIKSGSIGAASFTKTDYLTGLSCQEIAIADINGDGKPDVVIPSIGTNYMYFYINKGNLSFKKDSVLTNYNQCIGLSIADVDGDGRPDIAGIVANSSLKTGILFVLLNTSTKDSFSVAKETDFQIPKNPYSIQCGDLDGDGLPDFVVGFANGITKNNPFIVPNISKPGKLSFGTLTPKLTANFSSVQRVAITDIDGDGMPDIVYTDWDNNLLSILRNRNRVSVRLNPIAKDTICKGSPDKFSATTKARLFQWNLDGNAINKANDSIYYPQQSGVYTVTVSTASGCQTTSIGDTIVVNPVPSALFRAQNYGFRRYRFEPLDTTQLAYQWDFGDGNSSSGKVAFHVYVGDGKQRVTLKVTNASKCASTHVDSIKINTAGVNGNLALNLVALKAYPNPFMTKTSIAFHIDDPAPVSARVYDITGREVDIWEEAMQTAGDQVMEFCAPAPGMYFVRLSVGGVFYNLKLVRLNN